MPGESQIAANVPYLRRYARALTGSQASGDAFVQATLEAALNDNQLRQEIRQSRAALYRGFTRLWAGASLEMADYDPMSDRAAGGADADAGVQQRLLLVAPIRRQALLLTTLEDFSPEEAAEIMGLSVEEVELLAQNALEEIARETIADVLIIEDEPLIAMQLEDLLVRLGHTVCGIALTRQQALEVFTERSPGLVLADIQLADGSSGIDAVTDILALGNVPVIFITAFPEKLLTGERPEPTYLVTKPFREAAVQAAISQALFMALPQPQLAD